MIFTNLNRIPLSDNSTKRLKAFPNLNSKKKHALRKKGKKLKLLNKITKINCSKNFIHIKKNYCIFY